MSGVRAATEVNEYRQLWQAEAKKVLLHGLVCLDSRISREKCIDDKSKTVLAALADLSTAYLQGRWVDLGKISEIVEVSIGRGDLLQ